MRVMVYPVCAQPAADDGLILGAEPPMRLNRGDEQRSTGVPLVSAPPRNDVLRGLIPPRDPLLA